MLKFVWNDSITPPTPNNPYKTTTKTPAMQMLWNTDGRKLVMVCIFLLYSTDIKQTLFNYLIFIQ